MEFENENKLYYTVSVYNNVNGADTYEKVVHIDISEHYLTLELSNGISININHNSIFKYEVY